MMKKVYIYGLGQGKTVLDRCLLRDKLLIIAYVDNYKADKIDIFEGVPVIKSNQIDNEDADIIITLMQYESIKTDLINIGVDKKKIICFYDFRDTSIEKSWDYIDVYKWRIELMWKHYTEVVMPTVNQLEYEIYADTLQSNHEIPQIISAYDTVLKIIKEKKCLARFGDNEFEQILGRRRTNYQEVDVELGMRLREVLHSKEDNLLIAIADNYGRLDKYTSVAASAIRQYLGNGIREEHMKLLDLNRKYYDAYLSRPYYMYKDKDGAIERFNHIRQLWDLRDVLIVEGEHTRFGVGNDLLDNARSVQRILTLDKNCFSVYDKLLQNVKEVGKDRLILIVLGPVATIMAYDLAKMEKYWAIDIGQLDVEYEWCLRQVTERCDIPYKTVSEILQYDDLDVNLDEAWFSQYQDEIVAIIK